MKGGEIAGFLGSAAHGITTAWLPNYCAVEFVAYTKCPNCRD